MFDGLSVLPSNVWTMSVSLRGVPTSVIALAAAPAGLTAAAVGAAAPLVGASDGVGACVQPATRPATTTAPNSCREYRTILPTFDSPPFTFTLPPPVRPAAIRTPGSAPRARPVALAPLPAPSNPGGRAADPSPATDGYLHALPRRHLRGMEIDPAAIHQSSRSDAAP